MKIKKLSKEEINALSYDDAAFMILSDQKEGMKINELFKIIAEVYNLTENEFINQIADFFELMSTDKKFTIIEGGKVDLKTRHSAKIILDKEDEEELIADEELIAEDEEIIEEEAEEDIFYNTEDADADDDDDGLEGLVVIDEEEDTL